MKYFKWKTWNVHFTWSQSFWVAFELLWRTKTYKLKCFRTFSMRNPHLNCWVQPQNMFCITWHNSGNGEKVQKRSELDSRMSWYDKCFLAIIKLKKFETILKRLKRFDNVDFFTKHKKLCHLKTFYLFIKLIFNNFICILET